MIYKLRIILDTEEDVIREIAIDGDSNLEDLHYSISNAFGFDGTEMASFFMTDDHWNQGDEIPLFDMSEDSETLTMQHIIIKEIIDDDDRPKLIYVYDFFSMWSFFVEVVDILEEFTKCGLPALLFSLGIVPDQAPDKEFKSEESENASNVLGDGFDADDLDVDFDDLSSFPN